MCEAMVVRRKRVGYGNDREVRATRRCPRLEMSAASKLPTILPTCEWIPLEKFLAHASLMLRPSRPEHSFLHELTIPRFTVTSGNRDSAAPIWPGKGF